MDLQKAQEAFSKQQETSANNISETTESREGLTGWQIVLLGNHIVRDEDIRTLTQKYLNISQEKWKIYSSKTPTFILLVGILFDIGPARIQDLIKSRYRKHYLRIFSTKQRIDT